MTYYYTAKGDTPELLEGKFVIWCEQDTFYIESTKKLSSKGYTQISELPQNCQEWLNSQLKTARESKIKELNAACDKELLCFKSSALGEEYCYDLDYEDQINYIGLAIAGTDAFMRCYKVDANGELVGFKQNLPHSAAQIQQAYKDAAAHKMSAIAKCGELKLKAETATSLSEISAISW